MSKQAGGSSSILRGLFSLPTRFLCGYALGLAAPIAGLAGMAGIIYLVTHRVPFLSHTWPEEGDDRHLSLKLMPPSEARDIFEREKTRIGGEVNRMSAEIQSLAEQARASADASVPRKDQG